MGKVADNYTPEQRALFKKLAGTYTPQQRAALQKKPPAETPEQRAKLNEGREFLDDYVEIRNNQKRPPWAEQPHQPASADVKTKAKQKSEPKHKSKQKQTKPQPREKPGPHVMLSSAQIKEGRKLLRDLKRDPRRWKQKYQDLRKKLQTSASDKTLARYIRGLR